MVDTIKGAPVGIIGYSGVGTGEEDQPAGDAKPKKGSGAEGDSEDWERGQKKQRRQNNQERSDAMDNHTER